MPQTRWAQGNVPFEGIFMGGWPQAKLETPKMGSSPGSPHFQSKPPGGSEKRANCLFSFEKYKIPKEEAGNRPRQTGSQPPPTHTRSCSRPFPSGHQGGKEPVCHQPGLWLSPLPNHPLCAAFSPSRLLVRQEEGLWDRGISFVSGHHHSLPPLQRHFCL